MTAGSAEPSGSRPVRSGRSGRAPSRPTVAVTGAASGLGAALVHRLLDRDDVGRVVAVDAERGDAHGATWRVLDVRDPALVGRLRGVHTVAHLALDWGVDSDPAQRRSLNVRGTQTVLTAAAAAGVRRVVLCTSAMVYGALEDNPVPLDEDAPLRALADDSVLGDLLEIERLAELAPRTHPGLSVTVLRPAALVGEGVDSLLTRHFEAPRLLVLRDSRPLWQFCHVEDLLAALELAVTGEAEGVLSVACEGWLEQADVERISGMRRIELPAGVAYGTAERLHRMGVLPTPANDLQFLTHPWVVPSSRLRAAGWRPVFDNETALGALLERSRGHHALAARRLGRRDATLGAAGAAVAVVGTAALVRAARRHRRG